MKKHRLEFVVPQANHISTLNIIADTSVEAETMLTAVKDLTLNELFTKINSHESVEAFIVTDDLTIYTSQGIDTADVHTVHDYFKIEQF